MVRYINVLSKTGQKISSAIFGILPGMPVGTREFEEQVDRTIPEVQEGRRRGVEVAMLPV
jgi:hypothetical protein